MPWWLGGIIANIGIAYIEMTNRTSTTETWLGTLQYTAIPIILTQWGLYFAWKNAPSMMTAWVFFTAGNSLARIITAYWIGEPPGIKTWIAICMCLSAAVIMKFGGK